MPVQLGFKARDIIDEGRVTDDEIKQINIWLREEGKFPIISDEEIVNFLLSNDNDQENTKNTINAFFKIRNEAPDMFNNRFMTKANSNIDNFFAYCGIAPKRTEDNCAVIPALLHDSNFRKFNLGQFFKLLFMTLDTAIYTSPPSGLIIVIDMDGFGLMHLSKLRVGVISTFFRYLQEALPVKLKNIHILNTAYFIDKVLAIIKPLMSEHINQLLIFHKREYDMEEFYEKYVGKEFLPENFGGDLPSMKDMTVELIENLKNMESYFSAEEEQRSSVLKS